ncbi:hypothetical protein HWV62_841 [Athelia sp. TMB]|nr:hypothetical protein HWV62_841 [Athelia sp. TMB]
MDVQIRARFLVVRAASVVFAYVGFMLSLFSVVLAPLLPRAIAASDPGRLPTAAPHRRASVQSTTDSAESYASQSSSDASSISKPAATPTSPTRPPRPSSQRVSSLPAIPDAGSNGSPSGSDYFSHSPWVEVDPANALNTRPAEPTSSPAAPLPAPAPAPTPTSAAPRLVSAATLPPPVSATASTSTTASAPGPAPPAKPPLLRPATIAGAPLRVERSKSPGGAFRLPLRRSWIAHRSASETGADKAKEAGAEKGQDGEKEGKGKARAVTDPELRRPTSMRCFSKDAADERALRKSSSTPDGGLVAKWKVHRHRKAAPAPSASALPSAPSSPSSAPTPAPAPATAQVCTCKFPLCPHHHHAPRSPPARTQPYAAPYYFPPPGSPEAVDYVRRAREERSLSTGRR